MSVSEEIRRRIRVAVWAYAYEALHESLVPDHVFDAECRKVDLSVSTSYEGRDNSAIDAWFRKEFDPSTGCWIWKQHPGLLRIIGMARDQVEELHAAQSHDRCTTSPV